jgi:hypothetical protein
MVFKLLKCKELISSIEHLKIIDILLDKGKSTAFNFKKIIIKKLEF